jgi:hypothetical protein
MSQIEVNTNYNSVNVENTINTIDVNQDFGNILIVPQQTTNIVEIVTPGPQGAQGPPGDINTVTGSFVLTSSFNAFTASYTTGSFTGSFAGDGSKLTNISASNVVGLNLSQIASGSVTASISPDKGFVVNTNTTITGSLFVTNGITSSLFGTSSFAVSASQATSASYAISASYEIVYEESSSYADYAVSASQAMTASYITPLVQNVTITGSILFDGSSANNGASIIPNNGLPNSLDIIAGPGGEIELTSNNNNQYVLIDDSAIYIATTGNINQHVWTFTTESILQAPGDIIVNGLVSASDGFSGSLEGTASYAITASYALSATNIFPYTGSAIISGSLEVTGSISNTTTLTTNTFINPQTISVDINIPSDSNALIIGPIGIQEELSIASGSNLIILESLGDLATTSSNTFNGNQTINGTINISGSQISYQNNNNVDNGTSVIAYVDKVIYTGAFYDYTISDGINFRAGTITAVWNATTNNINSSDTVNASLGNTAGVIFSTDILNGNIRLLATVDSNNWIIKMLIRAL